MQATNVERWTSFYLQRTLSHQEPLSSYQFTQTGDASIIKRGEVLKRHFTNEGILTTGNPNHKGCSASHGGKLQKWNGTLC